jgi:hypothetical protein
MSYASEVSAQVMYRRNFLDELQVNFRLSSISKLSQCRP